MSSMAPRDECMVSTGNEGKRHAFPVYSLLDSRSLAILSVEVDEIHATQR